MLEHEVCTMGKTSKLLKLLPWLICVHIQWRGNRCIWGKIKVHDQAYRHSWLGMHVGLVLTIANKKLKMVWKGDERKGSNKTIVGSSCFKRNRNQVPTDSTRAVLTWSLRGPSLEERVRRGRVWGVRGGERRGSSRAGLVDDCCILTSFAARLANTRPVFQYT